MIHQRRPGRRAAAAVTFAELLETVRYEGVYSSVERAREVTLGVLAGLGRQLTGDERVELAAVLPFEAASELTAQVPAAEKLTGWGFVRDLADRTGASPATTRWDVGTVFAAVSRLAGPELTDRIIAQLPPGHALLFGRPELLHRQAA